MLLIYVMSLVIAISFVQILTHLGLVESPIKSITQVIETVKAADERMRLFTTMMQDDLMQAGQTWTMQRSSVDEPKTLKNEGGQVNVKKKDKKHGEEKVVEKREGEDEMEKEIPDAQQKPNRIKEADPHQAVGPVEEAWHAHALREALAWMYTVWWLAWVVALLAVPVLVLAAHAGVDVGLVPTWGKVEKRLLKLKSHLDRSSVEMQERAAQTVKTIASAMDERVHAAEERALDAALEVLTEMDVRLAAQLLVREDAKARDTGHSSARYRRRTALMEVSARELRRASARRGELQAACTKRRSKTAGSLQRCSQVLSKLQAVSAACDRLAIEQ